MQWITSHEEHFNPSQRNMILENYVLAYIEVYILLSLLVNSDNIMDYLMSKLLCSWKGRSYSLILLSFDHQVCFHILGLLWSGLNHSLTAQGSDLLCFTQERGYNYAWVEHCLQQNAFRRFRRYWAWADHICRQLLGGHVVVSWPIKRMHRMIKTLLGTITMNDFRGGCVSRKPWRPFGPVR